VQQQDTGTFAAGRIVIGEVAFERGVAVFVVHGLRPEFGRRRYRQGEQGGCKNDRHDTGVFHIFLPNVETKA
jgi:hypothetical protein